MGLSVTKLDQNKRSAGGNFSKTSLTYVQRQVTKGTYSNEGDLAPTNTEEAKSCT